MVGELIGPIRLWPLVSNKKVGSILRWSVYMLGLVDRVSTLKEPDIEFRGGSGQPRFHSGSLGCLGSALLFVPLTHSVAGVGGSWRQTARPVAPESG